MHARAESHSYLSDLSKQSEIEFIETKRPRLELLQEPLLRHSPLLSQQGGTEDLSKVSQGARHTQYSTCWFCDEEKEEEEVVAGRNTMGNLKTVCVVCNILAVCNMQPANGFLELSPLLVLEAGSEELKCWRCLHLTWARWLNALQHKGLTGTPECTEHLADPTKFCFAKWKDLQP